MVEVELEPSIEEHILEVQAKVPVDLHLIESAPTRALGLQETQINPLPCPCAVLELQMVVVPHPWGRPSVSPGNNAHGACMASVGNTNNSAIRTTPERKPLSTMSLSTDFTYITCRIQTRSVSQCSQWFQ